jgi:hypothetical protein
VDRFGRRVSAKLWQGVGYREDHLRAPVEELVHEMGRIFGWQVVCLGETTLKGLAVRPDYAVDVGGVRVGYIELKQPGFGVPTEWRSPQAHDQQQFDKLSLLPNVLYSDGNDWALFHSGEIQGAVGRLVPALDTSGPLRLADEVFTRLLYDFLSWKPDRPRTVEELVRAVARLCRLLRDEVAEVLRTEARGESAGTPFTRLASEWRELLFPRLTDAEFPDAYAQAVTFALLLARVDGIEFAGRSAGEIARLLGKKHTLMGTALDVMVHGPFEERSIVVETLIRVIGAVEWEEFHRDTYLYLYERFLESYDPELRKRTGAYYTPREVVTFMTRFVDELLRSDLGRPLGLAARDVIVVDPGMGTGSFLTEVIDRVATTVEEEEGSGQVQPRLRALADRLIGFESQIGAYAVAELRIHEAFKHTYHAEVPAREVRFLTDTLDDPGLQHLNFGQIYAALYESREGANQVKLDIPVMVVFSNPPYRERAKGSGPWLEERGGDGSSRPNLDAFRAPGMGRHEFKLANLYVYFWRWATWKVFDAHPNDPAGIVAFISPASYTSGPGFAGMREYLRRTADEGWIIDLTPEGHQPPVGTRVFPGNQQPVCIGVFLRCGAPDESRPARIHYTAVRGTQQEKFDALSQLSPGSFAGPLCTSAWTDPFTPLGDATWTAFPAVSDLLPWGTPGVTPNRTWVYASAPETLCRRWARLVSAPPEEKGGLLKETTTSALAVTRTPLPGQPRRHLPLSEEHGEPTDPVQVGYRSFDRQWVLPDSRLLDRPRPELWLVASERQIFTVEQHAQPITGGPALTFSSAIPDVDCFMGRGGRVLPLYRDGAGTPPNVSPGLLPLLRSSPGVDVTGEDLLAYIAALTAHSGYTARFRDELKSPGVRVPLTADKALFTAAVGVGREVLWLHTYGERCADTAAGRPSSPPRLPREDRPKVTVTIPDTPDLMPERIHHDADAQTLHVGDGQIRPVSPEVWEYHVSGMRIVKKWFGYRKKKPSVKWSSPLNDIHAETWTAEMTGELLDLLNVLGRCVALEPTQAELLDAVLAGPLITVADLTDVGVLPVPPAARKPPRRPPSGDDLLTHS